MNGFIKEKGIVDEKTLEALDDVISRGEKVRNRMRQMLNVDALG